MRCLVTGGAGFIGSRVADRLLALGHEVDVLDDMSGGFWRNIPEGARHFVCGCGECDYVREHWQAVVERDGWRGHQFGCSEITHGQVQQAMRGWSWDVVIHAAADATEGRSQFTPRHCTANGLAASVDVFAEAIRRGASRIVYLSSAAVYGCGGRPIVSTLTECYNEDSLPAPVDVYGANKAAGEVCLKALAEPHGIEWAVARPHNVFGERQSLADPYRNVVGIFMRNALEGRPLTVFGDGTQTRQFSHHSRVVEGIVRLATLPFDRHKHPWPSERIFNVGGDLSISVNELTSLVSDLAVADGLPVPEVVYEPERPCEVKHVACDNDRATQFGILDQPEPDEIVSGLASMWRWARDLQAGDGLAPLRMMELEIGAERAPRPWITGVPVA